MEMRRIAIIACALAVLILIPSIANSQGLANGAEVFSRTCTGYCHGANGMAGGAPQLVGRGFDTEYVERVITYGVPDTPMPAWGKILPRQELMAVIAYIKSLNGIEPPVNPAPAAGKAAPALSPEAEQGRDLFFNQLQVLTSCSICHQLNGRGVPVVARMNQIPSDASGLRNLATRHVSTATIEGESVPVLPTTQVHDAIKIYDLSTVPPVLRTFRPSDVELKEGSSWRHSSVLEKYSDSDLELILSFLRAAQQR
jgi:mono/diheme cytochrome c family protein